MCKREREISNAHTRNANSKTMSTCILTSKDLLYNVLRCDINCYCSESHAYADWDVSRIDNFEGIFENLVMLNTTGMETWEVTQVTSMARMFQGTTFLDGIAPEFLNKWSMQINNANNNILTNTSRMFFGSNIRRVFENEQAPYRKVVDMSYMFANTPIETIGSGIDTSSVKIFDCMFQNTSVFAGSMLAYGTPTFFTSEATSMAGMFEGASAYNADISAWHTYQVTNMRAMFKGATAFNQDLGNWNVQNVENFDEMFAGAAMFAGTTLVHWSAPSAHSMQSMFQDTNVRQEFVSHSHFDTHTHKHTTDVRCRPLQSFERFNAN